MHHDNLSDPVEVKLGVRQGCVLSPTLFLIVLDQVLRNMERGAARGISWGLQQRLKELTFADNICLLTHRFREMETKLQDLEQEGQATGLKINVEKTKSMRINSANNNMFQINGKEVEEVDSFTYLGSVLTRNGGADEDVTARIRKANAAFVQLYPVWRAREISTRTKLRIFNTNVKSVLLYGCETWKVSLAITHRLQVFVNRCLRKILNIYWPEVISNKDLWNVAKEEPIDNQIKKRKWKWIGHTLRKDQNNVERQVLSWNPQGQRRRGRPRKTCRRTIEDEIKEKGKSWGEVKALAVNRVRWHCFVEALCSVQE